MPAQPSSVDIDGGTIDGTTIGTTTPTTAVFTNLTANNSITLNGSTINSMATQASNAVDIIGGTIAGTTVTGATIDSTTIGSTSEAEAKFTTVTVSSSYIFLGNPDTNGSWRFAINDSDNLIFQQKTAGGWVSRYTITVDGGDN